MAELKTKKTLQSPLDFIESVDHPVRKADAQVVYQLMADITNDAGSMWGPSIIGFGYYNLKYPNGRELDWFLTGFSPRKTALSLYIMNGFDHYDKLLSQLGKYKTGKSCLYINKLDDVDLTILKKLITESVEFLKNRS